MRIVQIIDSLEAGGAEKMAVNYANALANTIEFSGLVATRREGLLLSQLNKNVSYLFLNKKGKIDLSAVFRLRKYLKENKVNVIHAHSSSFFTAVLVKLTLLKIKIIWHDHYGISQDLKQRKSTSLKISSLFFSGIISVNDALKKWAVSYLWSSNVVYFPNFISDFNDSEEEIKLNGIDGKRIVCVANLRPQKNHKLLIETASIIRDKFPDWSFHLFGKDFKDSYSAQLFQKIKELKLKDSIFFYGSINNVGQVLKQCDIAVLPSLSEGLPLAVLEYGLYKLPVVATHVGEIKKVITSHHHGIITESDNLSEFSSAVERLITHVDERQAKGVNLHKFVELNYSEQSIIQEYVLWIKSLPNFADNNSHK
ncbi:glycosyltransferase [Flavobacterium sp. H4147]|uniref:glycosyltransferase n=1 Tax=Flavobacterium sp. H4147 TaxID=3034149 RepID=UPI0023ED5704|nr:glycosyltransferase [Flavobacterium sp. H4147]